MREYLTHLVPLIAGPAGATTLTLNALARDGWRVVTSFPMPVQDQRALIAGGDGMGVALFVVLERWVRGSGCGGHEAGPIDLHLPGHVDADGRGGGVIVEGD